MGVPPIWMGRGAHPVVCGGTPRWMEAPHDGWRHHPGGTPGWVAPRGRTDPCSMEGRAWKESACEHHRLSAVAAS
eukprot:41204-Chlamydomonas_euryale.AAC.2